MCTTIFRLNNILKNYKICKSCEFYWNNSTRFSVATKKTHKTVTMFELEGNNKSLNMNTSLYLCAKYVYSKFHEDRSRRSTVTAKKTHKTDDFLERKENKNLYIISRFVFVSSTLIKNFMTVSKAGGRNGETWTHRRNAKRSSQIN